MDHPPVCNSKTMRQARENEKRNRKLKAGKLMAVQNPASGLIFSL